MVFAQLYMSLPTSFPFTLAPSNDKEAPYSPTSSPYEGLYRESPPLTPSIHFWSSPSPACTVVPTELAMHVDRHSSFHDCAHEPNEMVPGISWEQPPTPTSLPTASFEQPYFWTRTPHVRDCDAEEQEFLEGGGPGGGDAVNAAFLQLLDSQGSTKRVDNVLIKRLLRRGFLPRDELLNLVDWRQLQSLAARCVDWLLDSAAASRQPKHSHPLKVLESDTSHCSFDDNVPYTGPSCSRQDPALIQPLGNEFPATPFYDAIPRSTSLLISPDNSLTQALNHSSRTPAPLPLSVKLDNSSTDDEISPAITISPPPSLITPDMALPRESTPPSYTDSIQDSEPNSSNIITPTTDTPLAPKRRCDHCQTENTAQWRTHPEKDGHLCNACGQYLLRQGKPRPLDTIHQAKARSPRTSSKDDFLVPPPRSVVPEKRGGEVIMRVFSKSARRNSHSGETSIGVDTAV
ncbi:hypothetical protein R3P38DRAFT_3295494 [Favolaschia claudopus]|uniref:GATA-type domain-containing protein n=1 Tax=Favolaschia claudopus TaxID=2862362 RepID=A0AAV9ZAG4_9AGAR